MSQNFITNSDIHTLRNRTVQLMGFSKELKFLVGFFYFSGWRELYEGLKEHDEIEMKILVGLDVERNLDRVFEIANDNHGSTNNEIADRFFQSLGFALNIDALDNSAFYEQVVYFLRLIEEGRLHIKKTLEPNHAKLYLFRVKKEYEGLECGDVDEQFGCGRFITGSSNLTYSGLHGQNEFNVEISDYGWKEANDYYDELWGTAVPITEVPNRKEDLIRFVQNRTQVAEVTPFEAYVLVLKAYLDLVQQKEIKPHVIRLLEDGGYKSYQYQVDAVNQALSIIDQYNGVIIADVVGLGKTIIACMLARHIGRRGMIICPPSLIGDKNGKSGWRKYLNDFQLYDWEVRSSGALDKAADYLERYGDDIEIVIIDEAHRFRNEDTESYEWLSTICRNRNTILLTATPFNNRPADIFALLKLFIIPGKSRITLDENLEGLFSRYNSEFRQLSYIMRYHSAGGDKQKRAENYYSQLFDKPLPIDLVLVQSSAGALADDIRAVIRPVLIRRNRLDLKNDPVYAEEVTELSDVKDPVELFFELTPEQSTFYNQVVTDYFGEEGDFSGAIYQPFAYEEGLKYDETELGEIENRAYQQQQNLYNFMRRLLVKRFESSFGAFCQSIDNFIRVHKVVLEFINNSGGRYILDRKLIEQVYEDDPEEIDVALEKFTEHLSKKHTIPKHERIYTISDFELADEFIQDIESDLALLEEVRQKIDSLSLVEHDRDDEDISDPKAKRLVKAIEEILVSNGQGEPTRKVVIFSEYVDTVLYLEPILKANFPEQVLAVPGKLPVKLFSKILNNFDASIRSKDQRDNFQILLTSDKLSEGVDLNRAGAVIDYDIPWNPTRVIQRVGRINRIGKKVFSELYIYNFFPTEVGADYVKSRQIAEQKMFIIHNTLGEDAKIFAADEEPTASELYQRVNRNPELEEEESLLTQIRKEYINIEKEHPDVVKRVSAFPDRVKSAKTSEENQLVVFRRKGLGFFIQGITGHDREEKEVQSFILEDALALIRCRLDTPRQDLSDYFWPAYEEIKRYRETFRDSISATSVEYKALNNLQSAAHYYKSELDIYLPFIFMLIKDLKEYKTLPKFTLRRLANVDLKPDSPSELKKIIKELKFLLGYLGDDYLDVIEQRLGSMKTKIIIAVENQKKEVDKEN